MQMLHPHSMSEFMSNILATLLREVGYPYSPIRIARVGDLTEQIIGMRKELSALSRTVDSSVSAHHERLVALESFRRWAVGVMTGIVLSGVAAVFAWISRS